MYITVYITLLLTPCYITVYITYLALFLECVGQVTVGIREVGLQFNGPPVCVYG